MHSTSTSSFVFSRALGKTSHSQLGGTKAKSIYSNTLPFSINKKFNANSDSITAYLMPEWKVKFKYKHLYTKTCRC